MNRMTGWSSAYTKRCFLFLSSASFGVTSRDALHSHSDELSRTEPHFTGTIDLFHEKDVSFSTLPV